MARQLRRDVLAWVSSIPTSITLFICLGLPQVRDCHGHVKNAGDTGTSPLIIALALVALAPLAWRKPSLRPIVATLCVVVGMLAMVSTVVGIPLATYCLFIWRRRTSEQLTAFSCGCLALMFVILLPAFSMFSTWLVGAHVAWACGWMVMIAAFSWSSASRTRDEVPLEAPAEVAPEAAIPSAVVRALVPPTEATPDRIGDYTIDAELGAGGMARVYRGRHVHLDTEHAIKVLDPAYRRMPEARQRFLEEAKIQAKLLTHPNIVKVTNIVATPDHAALVMDLVDGPSLDTVLQTLPGNPHEIRRIMIGILTAVEHAHRCGVIHRDLKPGNVLLEGPGRIPRVTDFGIAKVIAQDYAPSSSTGGAARMGTLPYMSPEQIQGAREVTVRSDVFSLGIVLYEMTTGSLPFRGTSDFEVMNAIVGGRYFLPRVVDRQIARVIRRALQPDPMRRYASCRAMAEVLGGA